MTVVSPGFEYDATVLAVHDGDTCKLAIDLRQKMRGKDRDFGFRLYVENGRLILHETFRFFGINAPELSTQAGVEARDYLQAMLRIGDRVKAKINKSPSQEKYGRWLATIILADGTNVNEVMVGTGHAVVYKT